MKSVNMIRSSLRMVRRVTRDEYDFWRNPAWPLVRYARRYLRRKGVSHYG